MPDQSWKHLECVWLDHEFVMVCRPGVRNSPCMFKLVVRLVLKPYGESLDRLIGEPGHEANDNTRIDTAGKKRTERHVADHSQPDGFNELLAEAGARLLSADDCLRLMGKRPIPFYPRDEALRSKVERQRVSRGQLKDVLERSSWSRDVAISK